MSAASAPVRIVEEEAWPKPPPDPCPECGKPYSPAHPRQIFCCGEHKRAWEARSKLRGQQLLPFAIAARITRGGTRGKIFTGLKAQSDADMLMQRWREEDKAAGRMSAIDYLDLRYRLGFDRP